MSSVQEAPTQPAYAAQQYATVKKIRARDLPYDVFLRDYVAANLPVVIQDAAAGWGALECWTPEFFKQNFGSRTVEVTYGVKRQLAEVMDGVLASTKEKPGPYLHKVIIHQHMPELLPYLSPEHVYGFPRRYCSPLMPKRFHRPDGYLKLLIGGVGGKFPIMHYDSDNAHAMITEIYGDKEFVLFSPEDSPYVYPHQNSPGTSQIEDLDNVDLSRFPNFPKATQYRVTINPGECIFVPSRWWHAARVVSTSVSVCTNMIHSSNWAGFVDISCQSNGRMRPQLLAKRLYLHLAGAIMSAIEALQEKLPNSGLSRSLAHLSPISPAARR